MKKLLLILLLALAFPVLPSKVYGDVAPCDRRDTYTGNGTTTVFAYTCKIFNQDHLRVMVAGAVQTLTTQYIISGVGLDGGGNIAFIFAPANGVQVRILYDMPRDQTSSYIVGEGFPSTRVESDFDKSIVLHQQVFERVRRAPALLETSAFHDLIFPEPSAGKGVCWNKAGTELENCAFAGGGVIQHQVDGVNVSINDPINYQDSTTIDFTNPSVGNVQAAVKSSSIGTTHLADDSVTYAKQQNVSAASRLLGRGSAAGAGDPQEITLGSGIIITGTQLDVTSTGGDVTEVQGTSNEICMTSGTGPIPITGLCPTLDLQNKVLQGTNALVFEGSANDANETTFKITNPTADREITFPDATGTVPLLESANTFTGSNSFSLALNSTVGYQIAGTATSGNYLRGNGTNFVSSALLGGDLTANSVGPSQIDETVGYAFAATVFPPVAFASLPAAGTADRFRWVTDCESSSSCDAGGGTVRHLLYDDGVTWLCITCQVATPSLTTVMTVGNTYYGADCTAAKAFVVGGDANNAFWDCFDATTGLRRKRIVGGIEDAGNLDFWIRDTYNLRVKNRTDGTTLFDIDADTKTIIGKGIPQLVRKTAEEIVNNSAALQDDNHLLFAVAANETRVFDFVIIYDSGTTPDIKFLVTAPGGATGSYTKNCLAASATTSVGDLKADAFTAFATADACGGAGAATPVGMQIRGIVLNGATAGNITLQWAQNTANASDTKVLINSYVTHALF